MLKRNYFFLIPLLVVLALVIGVPGGADAKDFPKCPPGLVLQIKGPATVVHMRFYIDGEEPKIDIVGRCRNVEIDTTLTGSEGEWIVSEDCPPVPALQETDLEDLIIGTPADLLDELQECYMDDEIDIFCLQFKNVHNFEEITECEQYEADVILLRAEPQ